MAPFLSRHPEFTLGTGHARRACRPRPCRSPLRVPCAPCRATASARAPACMEWTASSRRDSAADKAGKLVLPRPSNRITRHLMSVIAPADQLRLALHRAGRLTRRLRLGAVSGPIGRLRMAGGSRSQLLIAPPDLRTADPTIAVEIYAGRFAFAGHVVEVAGRSPFDIGPPSEDWLKRAAFLRLAPASARRRHAAGALQRARHRGGLAVAARPRRRRDRVGRRRRLAPRAFLPGAVAAHPARRRPRPLSRLRPLAAQARQRAALRHQHQRAGPAAPACGDGHRADRPVAVAAGAAGARRPRPHRHRVADADPSRRRPHLAQPHRDRGYPDRPPAAPPGAHRARARPVRDADELDGPDDADAALLPARRRRLRAFQRRGRLRQRHGRHARLL